MTSSPQVNVEGLPAGDIAATPSPPRGTLRVDAAGAGRLQRSIVRLKGSCPSEGTITYGRAHEAPDFRRLSPLTIQYRSKEANSLHNLSSRQDRVRSAIWTSLSKALPSYTSSSEFPKVIFREAEEAKGVTLIDLVFPSSELFRHCCDFKELDVGGLGKERCIFERTAVSNALPRDVFMIDCVALSLEETSVDAVFSALTSIVANVGSLVGLARITARSQDWTADVFAASTNTLRLYVKLSRASMAAPLKQLATQLPTHFLWRGMPCKLYYVGCHLHEEYAYSANYPLDTAGGASSSTATGSPEREAADDSSAPVSKKRKTAEE